MAPLPRAYQWVDGSAYVNHVELVRKARGATMPASFWTDPLVYQGGSDDFLGPTDDVPVPSEEFGIDLEGEVAVITDDVPMGDDAAEAQASHQAADARQRLVAAQPDSGRARQGFRLLPVEAGDRVLAGRRDAGRARRRVAATARCICRCVSHINGQLFGQPNAGVDMTFDFAQLIAHVDAHATAARRHDRRLGHGLELRPLARLGVHRREAHARADRARQAADAVPEVRRPRAHRDARARRARASSARSTRKSCVRCRPRLEADRGTSSRASWRRLLRPRCADVRRTRPASARSDPGRDRRFPPRHVAAAKSTSASASTATTSAIPRFRPPCAKPNARCSRPRRRKPTSVRPATSNSTSASSTSRWDRWPASCRTASPRSRRSVAAAHCAWAPN